MTDEEAVRLVLATIDGVDGHCPTCWWDAYGQAIKKMPWLPWELGARTDDERDQIGQLRADAHRKDADA